MDLIKSGSSPVDWCENNYTHFTFIAEFFNTLSNCVFFIIPPIMMSLFVDYGRRVTYGIHVIWIMLIVVGLGSVYFHATLSMLGQLIDELSILWVLMTSYAILFPENYLPDVFRGPNRHRFSTSFFFMTVVCTCMCCVTPKLNAYFLMLFAVPVMSILLLLTRKCMNKDVVELAKRTVLVWLIAVVCWVCDRIFCDFWIRHSMPYFHSLFHVLVFSSASSSIVLYAYFSAKYQVPDLEPTLKYWPNNHFCGLFSLPYVSLQSVPAKCSTTNKTNSYLPIRNGFQFLVSETSSKLA